jgi:hypothetical protein
MNISVTLTPEEELEFTTFNGAAYDLYRTECVNNGSVPPCWLVMSEEAKQECQEKLYIHLREMMPVDFDRLSDFAIQEKLNNGLYSSVKDVIAKWKQAELIYKQYRSEGNPRAWFAG